MSDEGTGESWSDWFFKAEAKPPDAPLTTCKLDDVTAQAIVEIWKKTIDVQQHFNDLGMRVRNFGLTLLVGVLGGTALAVKEGFIVPLGSFGSLSLASLVLYGGAGAWIGFWFLDRRWYHRLLVGAVEHGMAIEKAFVGELPPIGLTHAITKASRVVISRRSSQTGHIVAIALILVTVIWSGLAIVAPGSEPRGFKLLLVIAVGILGVIYLRLRVMPNWEMKARYRLDVFYGLVFAILFFLAYAANAALLPNNQASGADWYGLEFRPITTVLDERRLDSAPRFTTLQACIAWGQTALRGSVGFECALRCRQDDRGLVCADSAVIQPPIGASPTAPTAPAVPPAAVVAPPASAPIVPDPPK